MMHEVFEPSKFFMRNKGSIPYRENFYIQTFKRLNQQ